MKKKWLLFLPILAVSLSGCSFIINLFRGDGSSSIAPRPSYNLSLPDPQYEEGDGYKKYTSFRYTIKEVTDTTGQKVLNSTGEAKLLVIPVEFGGASDRRWDNTERNSLHYCFFGRADDTGWESVTSFYEKASYGRLSISGRVAPTFRTAKTYAELDAAERPDSIVVDEFQKSSSYRELCAANGINLVDYDVHDKDGYLDSVVFIYREKIQVNGSDMRWWAFQYVNNSVADLNNPKVNSYVWASFDFSRKATPENRYGGKYDKDAHTYIHECGHLFGIDDYYSYDDGNYYDPSGGQEMHSQNIGDENIYSKLLMGWVDPIVVNTTSSVEFTIRTSSAYGDCIIINDKWNETALDEYLIIEYYSPTVLNEKDSLEPYVKGAQMFTTSGFRIYHVDARLVAYNKTVRPSASDFVKRLDEIDPTYFNFVGASNSSSYPYSHLQTQAERSNYKLLHMMQAGGVNTYKSNHKGANGDLFVAGQSFQATSAFFTLGNKFNNGNKVGYRLDIVSSDLTQGVIRITKI